MCEKFWKFKSDIDFTDVIKYSYLKKKGGSKSVCEAKNAIINGRRSERNAGNGWTVGKGATVGGVLLGKRNSRAAETARISWVHERIYTDFLNSIGGKCHLFFLVQITEMLYFF